MNSAICTEEGNKLRFKGKIGAGRFTDVHQACFQGKKIAVKVIDLRNTSLRYQRQCLRDDVRLLTSLKHINLIEHEDILQRKTKIYLLMKMVNGGNLHQMMERRHKLEEFECKVYMRQIAEAIAYLHKKEVAHGDVRLENIMWYPEYNIKLTAFSFSKRIGDCNTSKKWLLPRDYSYWMPEMLREEEYEPMLADNWAAGVVAFVLVNGTFPFDDKNRVKMLDAQMKGEFKNKHHVVSGIFKDFLREIFEPNIKERSTMFISLTHRWLKAVPNYTEQMLLKLGDHQREDNYDDDDDDDGDDGEVMPSPINSP